VKITLLGTGTPTPPVKRAGSGYLVETKDEVFVFDCGPCSYARFLQAGLHPTAVSQLFISHWHYDHCTDLPHYVLQRWDQGGGKIPELNIYGPTPIKRIISSLFSREGVFGPDQDARTKNKASVALFEARGGTKPRKRVNPRITETKHGSVINGKNWSVNTIEVPHAQPYLQSVAYRLDSQEGSFVYSGDSGPTKRMVAFAAGADVLVHMCHFISGTQWGSEGEREAMEKGCGSHKMIATLAKEAAVKTVVLTHITLQIDVPGVRERVVHEVSEIYNGNVILGEDLMQIWPKSVQPGKLL
jgi:ribonuclease Z